MKITVYNMTADEVLHLMERRNYTLCKELTPEHYDYKPKYIHFLEDTLGKRLVITAKSYNSTKMCFK
jgi:hypothetical protein